MGHHDHLWRELVELEERLKVVEEVLKRPRKDYREYRLRELEWLKKRIKELNEELNDLGDFKYN